MKYKVIAYDNFGYAEGEFRRIGEFDNMFEAVGACKRVIRESVQEIYKPGMTADELLSSFRIYGEVTGIHTDDEQVPFDPWEYAGELIEEICADS